MMMASTNQNYLVAIQALTALRDAKRAMEIAGRVSGTQNNENKIQPWVH